MQKKYPVKSFLQRKEVWRKNGAPVFFLFLSDFFNRKKEKTILWKIWYFIHNILELIMTKDESEKIPVSS